MTYVQTAQNGKSGIISCMTSSFYFILWSRLVQRRAQNYKNDYFFNTFISFGLFPQDFGQINE